MAIRILGFNVGESDVTQPGDITTLRWDFGLDLVVAAEAVEDADGVEITPAVVGEEITSVAVIATNRAGEDVTTDIVAAKGFENGATQPNSVATIRIHNLVDGERYKLQLVATITESEKVATVTIFVPVVAP